MSTNRKLTLAVIMLIFVAFAMSPMASAKDGGLMKFKRDAGEAGSGNPGTGFGDSSANKVAESCSGSCSCSTCVCSGSIGCCGAGCGACWQYRDDQGLCNAAV